MPRRSLSELGRMKLARVAGGQNFPTSKRPRLAGPHSPCCTAGWLQTTGMSSLLQHQRSRAAFNLDAFDSCSSPRKLCPNLNFPSFLGSARLRNRGGNRAEMDTYHLVLCCLMMSFLPEDSHGHTCRQSQASLGQKATQREGTGAFLFSPTQNSRISILVA